MSAQLRQVPLDERLGLKRVRVIAQRLDRQVDPKSLRNRSIFRTNQPFLGRRQDFRDFRLHTPNFMPSGGEVKP